MASVTASSGVKLKASTGNLSGSTTISGTNDRGVTSTLATILASGKPTKGGSAFWAGSSNGWNLNVTYNNDGTATGQAGGSFASTTWAPDVNVDVDAPGRSRHGKKRKAKAGKRVTKKKGRKKTARKTAKKVTRKPAKKVAKKARKKAVTRRAKPRTAARRAKAPARKKKSARR